MARGIHVGAPREWRGGISRKNHEAEIFGHCVRPGGELLWRALTRIRSRDHSPQLSAAGVGVRRHNYFRLKSPHSNPLRRSNGERETGQCQATNAIVGGNSPGLYLAGLVLKW